MGESVDIDGGVEDRSPAPFSDPRRWYEEHYPLVHDAVRRFGVRAEAVDDAVQETFVTAYRRRNSFRGGSSVAWLYAIARRVASNTRRADYRHGRKKSALKHAGVHAPAPPRPETGAAVAVVERFLGGLRRQEREVFALSEIEGLSGPEIARCMDANLATTYFRIREVRKRFAEFCDAPADAIASRRARRAKASHAGWAALGQALGSKTLGGAPAVGFVAGIPWATSLVTSVGVASIALLGLAGAARLVAADDTRQDAPATTVAASAAPRAASSPAAAASPGATPDDRRDADPPSPVAATRPPEASRGLQLRPIPSVGGTRPRASGPPAPSARGPSPAPAAPAVPLPRSTPAKPDDAALTGAVAALRDDRPGDALRLIASHTAQHPSSSLADMRAALRVEALCAAGRTQEGRSLARAFERAHAGSAALARVRKACPP